MKAVGFFYTWNGRRTLDPYFGQVADAFAELGIELKIILANELIHPKGGQETLSPFADEAGIVAFVNRERPDLIFSVNNAGMTARVEAGITAPIIKWWWTMTRICFSLKGSPFATSAPRVAKRSSATLPPWPVRSWRLPTEPRQGLVGFPRHEPLRMAIRTACPRLPDQLCRILPWLLPLDKSPPERPRQRGRTADSRRHGRHDKIMSPACAT